MRDGFVLYNVDCLNVMSGLPNESIDMVYADPPYMLFNNGITCKSGKMVSVNKGELDISPEFKFVFSFQIFWIKEFKIEILTRVKEVETRNKDEPSENLSRDFATEV